MKKIIFYAIIFFLPFNIFCQSVAEQELKWSTIKTTDRITVDVIDQSTYFLTKPSTIEWVQNSGQLKYNFTITDVDGNWNDVTQNGQITFNVTRAGYSGTIIFKREDTGVTVEMTMAKSGMPGWSYSFIVESVIVN